MLGIYALTCWVGVQEGALIKFYVSFIARKGFAFFYIRDFIQFRKEEETTISFYLISIMRKRENV
jgi:hypothetical protein